MIRGLRQSFCREHLYVIVPVEIGDPMIRGLRHCMGFVKLPTLDTVEIGDPMIRGLRQLCHALYLTGWIGS